jgi:iron complex outermembrane receptor protein
VRVTTTGFYYTVKDLITQQTDPSDNLLVYNNLDTIKAHGLELEFEGKWAHGFESRIGYTFQDSRNQATGVKLTNSPTHVSQVNLISPLVGRHLFAGLELRHMSARQTIGGNQVPSAFTSNLTFSGRELAGGVQLAASVFNLFDTVYADPASEEHRQDSIAQNGRSVRVTLTVGLPFGR